MRSRNPRRQALADHVFALVKSSGRSVLSVANNIGMSDDTLMRRLRGINPFTVDELDAVADDLGTTTAEIMRAVEDTAA
jgi:transcriptional regulator with XRE-family HTH domain